MEEPLMEPASLAAYLALVIVLVVSPGPNSLLLMKTVPTSGRAAGVANAAGFIIGFYLHGLLAFFGLSLILLRSAEAFTVVKAAGALYLGWIGAKALWQAWKGVPRMARDVTPQRRKRTLFRAFWEGFLTNLLNPKVALFYLALYPQYLPRDGLGEVAGLGQALFLVSLHAVVAGLWFALIIVFVARLAALTKTGRLGRWLQATLGAVFLGFAARLAAFKP
ncbi:MAG: LysE family translocator [Rhodospirillales bacterium]